MTEARFDSQETRSEVHGGLPRRLTEKGLFIRRSVKHWVRLRKPQQRQQQQPMSPQEKPQVYVVGSPSPGSPYLRIVHVSDTCDAHDAGVSSVFDGDVLVHSGNLCSYQFSKRLFREAEFHNQVKAINEWFARMPQAYKIFVPGPNEILFDTETRENIQALLPNCIYLQDSECVIEGVKFYGMPWSQGRRGNVGRGFCKSPAELKTVWSNVPEDVDVFVSHSVPSNSIYDELVTRIRPKLFLFGGRHQSGRKSDGNAVRFKDNVIFSDGRTQGAGGRRGLFDFYADGHCPRRTRIPSVSTQSASEAAAPSSRLMLLRCIFS